MPSPSSETLCRILCGRAVASELQSLTSEEWDDLIATANSEGLSPMVYWTFSQSGQLESLRESARHALSAAYAVTRFHTEGQLEKLETLAQQYRQTDIP